MAKVRIVYVPDADRRGPDLARIGTVEDVADDLARLMVSGGEAVYVDEDEPAEQVPPTVPTRKPAPADTSAA